VDSDGDRDPGTLPMRHLPADGEDLTPGEALAALFMRGADRGANAPNDGLIEKLTGAMRARARAQLTEQETAALVIDQLPDEVPEQRS